MALSVGGTPITPEQLATLQADLGIVVAEEITARYTSLLGTDDSIFLRSGVPGLVSVDVMTAAFGDTPPQTLTQSSRFNNSQTFYAPTVALAASGPVFVQRTSVAIGNYTDAVATFGSPVTAGNTIIIYGAAQAGAPSGLTTNQSDTVVLDTYANFGGSYALLGYINSAVGGSTTLTMGDATQIKSFYAEEWENAEVNTAAGLGQNQTFADVSVSTPSASTVANAISASVWIIRSGVIIAQTVPSGWTEGARQNTQANAQFVGAFRAETTTGVKTAAWVDPGTGEGAAAQIRVFGTP